MHDAEQNGASKEELEEITKKYKIEAKEIAKDCDINKEDAEAELDEAESTLNLPDADDGEEIEDDVVDPRDTKNGGKYVRMQEGKLTFNVNVTNAGMYNVKIAYSLTEDYKAQFLTVNGAQVGTVAFNQSGTSNPTFASVDACVVLNAGANNIGLDKCI